MPGFILIHPTVWPQYTNVADRQTGQTDRHTTVHSMRRTVLNKSSTVAEMGDRGHNKHGPKRGGFCAPYDRWGNWVPVQHNVARAEVCFRTKWRIRPSSRLATIDMNRKLKSCALLGGGATPSNTTSPGPSFTSVPSGILIHAAVWPQ